MIASSPSLTMTYVSLAEKVHHAIICYGDRSCFAIRPSPVQPFQWSSFARFGQRAMSAGAALRSRILAGAVVMIIRQRDQVWYEIDIGCALAGLVSLGVDPTCRDARLLALIRTANPSCVVTDGTTLQAVLDTVHLLADPPVVLIADESECNAQGALQLDELVRQHAPSNPFELLEPRLPDQIATLICTSGSSGHPKLVALTDAVWSRRVYQQSPQSSASLTSPR